MPMPMPMVGATPALATGTMRAIGTTATVVVTAADRADRALALLAEELASLDRACSRFRPDSELMVVERSGRGRPVPVGPLLFDSLDVALDVAVQTAGIVDPTIGSALVAWGYDRDFALLGAPDDSAGAGDAVTDRHLGPAPGWWHIELDPGTRTVTIPDGVHVDLGATAKAFAADRAAARLADELGCGVLVNLGGDVAVGGDAPAGGWAVGIASECTVPGAAADQVVAVRIGGLAT